MTDVSDVTKFPEMMDGRVKTLHPAIHAGILARPNHEADAQELAGQGLDLFEVVVVNLYQFEAKAAQIPPLTAEELMEEIDIGGPSLIRAAAKNWERVYVVTSPRQYQDLLRVLFGRNPLEQRAARFQYMQAAFQYTAAYDRAIADEVVNRIDMLAGNVRRILD